MLSSLLIYPDGCDSADGDSSVHLVNLKPGTPAPPAIVPVTSTANAAPNTVQVVGGYLTGSVDLTLAPGTAVGDQINVQILDIGSSGVFSIKDGTVTVLSLTAPLNAPVYLRYQWSGTAWIAV